MEVAEQKLKVICLILLLIVLLQLLAVSTIDTEQKHTIQMLGINPLVVEVEVVPLMIIMVEMLLKEQEEKGRMAQIDLHPLFMAMVEMEEMVEEEVEEVVVLT